jgi:TPR repeat protein/uncharacterized membrane protein
MRRFRKIVIPVFYLIVIVGLAALFWVGKKRADERKLAEDAQACRVRAEQGDVKSEVELAHLYSHGIGLSLDYAEALRWLRKAADQGNARAEGGIGYMYHQGYGVQQNDAVAFSWFQKSADHGYAFSADELGYMYSHGFGITQDSVEAVKWYRMAADQGNAHAQRELGYMYYHGQGVRQDSTEAVRWYRKAADQGYAIAESSLGYTLFYGYGVTRDYAEAKRLFRKAADQGDAYALRTVSSPFTTVKRVALIIQFIGGFFIAISFWTPGSGFMLPGTICWNVRQSLVTVIGVCCIFSAGLSWYGYTHHKILCLIYGVNAFMVTKWLLNATLLALIMYVIRTSKKSEQQQDEMAVAEGESN